MNKTICLLTLKQHGFYRDTENGEKIALPKEKVAAVLEQKIKDEYSFLGDRSKSFTSETIAKFIAKVEKYGYYRYSFASGCGDFEAYLEEDITLII